ncbi:MAG: hypothetical protein ACK5IP_03125 [Paracoccus sp. (in: a-proteobacteria)]
MSPRLLIRLRLVHGYDDPGHPALRVVAPSGVMLRQLGGEVEVFLSERQEMPAQVSLSLLWQSVEFCLVTEGYDWSGVPVLVVGADRDRLVFGTDPVLQTLPRGRGDRRVLQLDIAVTEGARRDIRLDFEAVATHWAYHLTGRGLRDDIRIVDRGNRVRFDDLGVETLPDGTPARVLRSAEPLALCARPPQRFALQYEGQFGPVVLVPALPAAGVNIRPLADGGGDGRLQSDIYVTLS